MLVLGEDDPADVGREVVAAVADVDEADGDCCGGGGGVIAVSCPGDVDGGAREGLFPGGVFGDEGGGDEEGVEYFGRVDAGAAGFGGDDGVVEKGEAEVDVGLEGGVTDCEGEAGGVEDRGEGAGVGGRGVGELR